MEEKWNDHDNALQAREKRFIRPCPSDPALTKGWQGAFALDAAAGIDGLLSYPVDVPLNVLRQVRGMFTDQFIGQCPVPFLQCLDNLQMVDRRT